MCGSELCVQVDRYESARTRLGLGVDARGGVGPEYAAGLEGMTPRQLRAMAALCLSKYERKRIDPGAHPL